MVDVSIITSYIDLILSFIFDHIGAIVAILIVFMGIRSSQRKKRRAQEESDGETPRKKSLREIMAEMEAELNKSADDQDLETEMEIEEDEETEGPPVRPYGEGGSLDSPWQQQETASKRQDTPWSMQESAPEGPVREPEKPLVFPSATLPKQAAATVFASASFGEHAALQGSLPLTRSADMRTEAPPMEVQGDSEESGGNCYFRKKKLNPEAMVDAVVMAEILAKPKALRRAGQRI
ncbi:MAG TPA: hypothetical protein PKD52_01815 [Clostridiales bacterium]|nr:hypothetical protein [Clostridiales bacterium]